MIESEIDDRAIGQVTDAAALDRGKTQFERALRRRIAGLDYLPSLAPFEGASPRDRLIANGTLNLYRYRPQAEPVHRVPILLVMATGSRGYVADLGAGNSLVAHLLKAGFDLFMIDWSPPLADEKHLKLENYVLDFLPRCVSRIRKETGQPQPTLIGYRAGGVLAMLWAALNADADNDRAGSAVGARNLVCIATPFDYAQLSLFQAWADRRFFDVDKLVDRFGCCPADMADGLFETLERQPAASSDIGLRDRLRSHEQVLALHNFTRWMGDILPQAGEYFRQTIKRLLWENRLMHGSLEVGRRLIDPSRITAPFLQIVAEQDVLIPPEASCPLIDAIGSADRNGISVSGGHAGLFLGAEAQQRLWPALTGWLETRSS